MNEYDVQAFKNAVYIMSQATCAQADIEGMKAENKRLEYLGEPPKYLQEDFMNAIVGYGIHHNQVLTTFNR